MQAVDWWSLGILTYELLTGRSPFTIAGAQNTHSEVAKYAAHRYPTRPQLDPLSLSYSHVHMSLRSLRL